MEAHVPIQTTAPQMSAVEPHTGKVYVFVEPTPLILKLLPKGRPDEHQGAHCVSFVLDKPEAVRQALLLTEWCQQAHEQGTQ